jgi:hypothetical protein
MAKVIKPTAQQKAQAKARAGGKDAIKVTNAGVKRLGKAALIAGSMLPAGRAVKVASMAIKAGKAAKAAKSAKSAKSSRQAYDYPVSKESAKTTMGKAGTRDAKYVDGRDTQISKNVSIKNTKSPSGGIHIRGGAAQVFNRELRESALGYSKAEAKANARGLKAANKPVSKNNRNVGGPVLTGILKRSEPARANRTRLGKTTKKSK